MVDTTATGNFLVATTENLYEVVAMLRPDLCLIPRRQLDAAVAALIDARSPTLVREDRKRQEEPHCYRKLG